MNSSEAEKTPSAASDDSFATRWSRRKQAVREEQLSTQTAAEIAATEPPEVSEPHQLCDTDMPPLDSLTEDSDYRGFLSPKVSEALRRKALHILFHGPSFNLCDGLDDYDEDFTHFAKLGNIITADMRHQMEVEAKRLLERADAEKQMPTQTQANIQTQIENPDRDTTESQLASNEAAVSDTNTHDVELEQ